MNRHSLLFAAIVAFPSLGAFAQDAEAPAQEPRPTGTFFVSVPERRADQAVVTARVERRLGTALLVGTRRTAGRHGANVVFVYETPKSASTKNGWLGKYLAAVGRSLSGTGQEITRKLASDGIIPDLSNLGKGKNGTGVAKGKPITMPIFDSDFNGRAVNSASVRSQPAMTQTTAIAAQQKARGSGHVVAVLDGGFDLRHEFLQGHLYGGYDAINDTNDPQDLGNGVDDDGDGRTDLCVGHGNFVASLILSVAPDAVVLPIRVLDDEAWGTDLAVAAGITYAVDHGASVVNLSLVLPKATQVVKDAVKYAVGNGVVIVAAAGTTDDGWQSDPYLRQNAIVVGAVDGQDVIPDWSQSGNTVNVFAPGVWPVGALGGGAHPGSYGTWSGVSFSVPFLAGGAAMIREKHPWPDWSIAYVMSSLNGTADTAYNSAGDPTWRNGRVDLNRAVK